jgi:hypothetical protein
METNLTFHVVPVDHVRCQVSKIIGMADRRQGRGFRDGGAPVGQAVLLVPVEIVDQRIALRLPHGVAGEPLRGAANGGLDGGEGVREQPLGATVRRKPPCEQAVAGVEVAVQAPRVAARGQFGVRVPLPARPRKMASPAGVSAQPGSAAAMRRRARSTACARMSARVGAWMSRCAS